MSKLQVLALIFFFCCPISLFADQIVLKNGDRLAGSIEKSDDKALLIKTEFAGEVTVKWPAVQEINSTQPLNVSLSDGKTGNGNNFRWQLAIVTPNAGTVIEPKTSVTRLFGSRQPMKNRCIQVFWKDGKVGRMWGLR